MQGRHLSGLRSCGYSGCIRAVVASAALVGTACDAAVDEALPAQGEGAVARAYMPADDACNTVGVIELVMRARWIGCLEGVQCSVPKQTEWLGTRVTCPSTAFEVLGAVEVPLPGRWVFDMLSRHTTGETARECLADDGQFIFPFTGDQVARHVVLQLEATGSPCPEP